MKKFLNNNKAPTSTHSTPIKQYMVTSPSDFDNIMSYIDAFVSEPAMINLDNNDVIALLNLNIKEKTCFDGQLQAIEFSCHEEELEEYGSMINALSGYTSCLAMITIDMALGLAEVESVLDMLSKHCNENTELLVGVQLKDDGTEKIDVCIICR